MEGESRSDRKRREILTAARQLFSTEGYAATGMEAVAREARVSTATLYAHFPSKTDLFQMVAVETLAAMGDGVRRTVEARGSARDRLMAFARAYAAFYTDPTPRALFRVLTAERRRFGDAACEMETRCRRDLGGTAIRIIGDLANEGHLSVEKASWAAGQLLGMIEHATLIYSMVSGDEARRRRPIDALCDDAVTTFLARYGVTETAG